MTQKEIQRLSDIQLSELIRKARMERYVSDYANELYVKLMRERDARDDLR